MVFVFIIQEYFEMNAFMKPSEKTWSLLMDASGFILSITTGPMFLPVFNTMLWPFQRSASESSQYLYIYKPLGAMTAFVAAYYSLRYVRVDKNLRRINANGIGAILWSEDEPMTDEDRMLKRRHPCSPMSPQHDKAKLIAKIFLSVSRIVLTDTWPIVAAVLRVLVGFALLYIDLVLDAFYPANKGIDLNALNMAASAGIAINYCASLVTVLLWQTHLEHDPQAVLERWKAEVILCNLMAAPAAFLAYHLRRRVRASSSERTECNITSLQEAFTGTPQPMSLANNSDLATPLLKIEDRLKLEQQHVERQCNDLTKLEERIQSLEQ